MFLHDLFILRYFLYNFPLILTVIFRLSATDMDTDSTILYYITSGNVDSTFYLNPVSGGVYAQRELDYDPPVNDRIFNLTVILSYLRYSL